MTDAGRLATDRRWQRFLARDYACPCCGQPSTGLYDIGYDHPDSWPYGNRAEAGVETLKVGEAKLGTDLCTFDDGFYIRCTLPLPIRGSDAVFSFGPWASISEESFGKHLRAWQADDYTTFPGCFGWLVNTLPGFEMEKCLPCDVEMGSGEHRPELFVHDGAHLLAELQRDGITFDQLLDIYAAAGQDHRPHLGDA